MSARPSELASYSSQVAARLRGLPVAQRREVAEDVQRRLVDLGIVSWEEAVQQLGPPAAYAEELRAAADWPMPRRRRWPWVALVVVAVTVGGLVVWQRATAVPKDYPLVFASRMQSGAGTSAGSVIVMPDRVDDAIQIAFEIQNQGDRTVRIDGLRRAVGASTQGELVVMGSDGDPPLWSPEARMFRHVPDAPFTLTSFDDDSGLPLDGFTIAPGEAVVLQLRGSIAYCVETQQGTAVGDHIRLDTTIDGEHRVINGTELSFPLGNCS